MLSELNFNSMRILKVLLLVALSATLSFAQWTWKSPSPQGNTLLSMQFVDTAQGWAVGEYGTIIHTSDGGRSWDEQEFGSTDNILGLSMVTSSVGWAAGDNGSVLHTTNGGDDWIDQSSGTSAGLNSVFFVDAQNGWAAGDNETIIHTTNGGLVWSSQHLAGPAVSINEIIFIDLNNGWAVGSNKSVFMTTDGGTTWSKSVIGFGSASYLSINFVSSTLGFIAGTGGTILRTDNGGTSWSPVSSGVLTNLNQVVMQNSVVGWIAGDAGVLLKTLNGGLSWSVGSIAGGFDINGLSKFSGKLWTSGELGTIFLSTNSGVAWSGLDAGPRLSANWIDAPSSLVAVAVGQTGLIMRTTDAGLSWTKQASPDSTVSCYGVKFADASHGWAVGDHGSIFRTVDGASWSSQSSPTSAALLGITFASASEGWIAAGDFGTFGGLILHSSDGGGSWTVQNPSLPHIAYGLSFPTSLSGWVVGEQGMIVHTSNAGSSWQPQSSGVANALYWCSFSDGMNGWAVGDTGTILRTTNGGASWTRQTTGVTDIIYSVVARTALDAVAAGDNGVVLYTSDGGQTWQAQYTRTLHSLFGIARSGSSTVWASGDYGSVLANDIPLPPSGNVSGIVFDDLNNNGSLDTGEPVLPGRKVRLGGDRIDSTSSGTNGAFLFSGLSNGSYTLSADSLTSWTQTMPPSSYGFTLDALNPNFSGNFGFYSSNTKGYPVSGRWNLVSVPLVVGDPRKTTLFPYASSTAFAFETAYQIKDSLRHGIGYWLKFPQNSTAWLTGLPMHSDTIHVLAGWNLIGSVFDSIPASTVSSDPPGIMASNLFEFSGSYKIATSILPTRGYWVKSHQAGSVILPAPSSALRSGTSPPDLSGFNRLTISDPDGNSATLYFGFSQFSGEFALPPAPPPDCFDARFADGSFVMVPRQEGSVSDVKLQSSKLPLTVSWDIRQPGYRYYMRTSEKSTELSSSGRISLNNLDLALGYETSSLPHSYSLFQNAPNPFNPATNIRFALPVMSRVRLSVFTILGQEVAALVDGTLDAGYHEVTWVPATSSGVYFYRIDASALDGQSPPFAQVRKMLYVR